MMMQYHPFRKSSFVDQLTGIAVMAKGSWAEESEVRHDPLTPVEPRLIFVSYCIISLIHGLVCLKVHNAHTNWPKLSFCCNLKFFGQKLYKLPSLQIFSRLLPDGAPLLRLEVRPLFAFEVFGELRKVCKGNVHPPRSRGVASKALGGLVSIRFKFYNFCLRFVIGRLTELRQRILR